MWSNTFVFNNIGKRIKLICELVFFLLLLAGIAGWYLIVSLFVSDFPERIVWTVILSCIWGGLLYLSVMILYAFGELVDQSQIQTEQNKVIIGLLGKGNDSKSADKDVVLDDNNVSHFYDV